MEGGQDDLGGHLRSKLIWSGGRHTTGSREGLLVRGSGAQSPGVGTCVDVTLRVRDAPGHSPSLDICFGAHRPGDYGGDPGVTGADMPRASREHLGPAHRALELQ